MDESTLFSLLVDLHKGGERQGPGGSEQTLMALKLSGINPASRLAVADIGCGTGASTRVLAENLVNAHITAVDLFPEFLQVLADSACAVGYSDRVSPLAGSMESLPFDDQSLDLIWSEGAIYNMGFGKGVEAWRRLLRPGGVLAVSEITWLRPDPPDQIRQYWEAEYAEIGTAAEKIAVLEGAGYDLLGHFILPPSCWIENYYQPTEARIDDFLQRHADQPQAQQLIEMERQEAAMYEKWQSVYGYGFYVARKRQVNLRGEK
ncbi:MAG: class I SAM-dependent methyltransferase [Gammaproteobacteria bacterium]|nr:class I SAM-dependent methyltransferase [Gammaproteobacteria bacterium]